MRINFVTYNNSGSDRRIWRTGEKRRAERGALFGGESVFERTARDSSCPVYRDGDN